MSTDSQQQSSSTPVYERKTPWVVHTVVSFIIIAIAFAVVGALMGNKPKAGRWGNKAKAPSIAVEIEALKAQTFDVWVDSYGTVESLTRTQLVSDVNGRVMSVSSNIRAGKYFTKGEVLATLDDRDFKVEVNIAASAVADAELAYLQEVAEAEFAAQEWNKAPETEAARKLALREPQLAAAKASLEAAKARLDQARLNLERTRIIAPFNGKVLNQMIDVGQVVGPTQAIAEIYSTDAVEVRLPIKMADLHHLTLPEDSEASERPRVLLESDLGNQTWQWQAEVVRTEGAFDPATRMLFVVARVIDPFVNTTERPAIRIGQFVRAKLQGNQYDDVFVIPRRAVSQDLLVSIAVDGVLQKRRISPLWTDSNSVVVSARPALSDNISSLALNNDALSASLNQPLLATDKIILTPTANVPNGTRVKSLLDEQNPNRLSQQSIAKRPDDGQKEPAKRSGDFADTRSTSSKENTQNSSDTASQNGDSNKNDDLSKTGEQ